jgi:erythromycin esterase
MDWRTIKTLLQPQELDVDELGTLAPVVHGSKIIGVGEGAHFVSEFSLARNSIIRYLVERHDFNTLGLECGAIQASRLSGWLHSTAPFHELEQFSDVLTFSMYGSVLIWLKSYLEESGKKLQLVGIDLPNTLNPKEDLEQLAEAIQIIDPLMKSQAGALTQVLASIDGQSAYVSSAKWGALDPVQQDKALSVIIRLKHRLDSLAPILKKHSDGNLFRKASDRIFSIEYTLETLRIMKTFFDGDSIESDTSVRDSYMAAVVDRIMRTNPDVKMIVLAHNNHIQKTPVSFSGELTAVPMGQHLADRKDYRAIALTHLGPTVPEMDFPAHDSPVGFSVVTIPADVIREDSIEQYIINICGTEDSCLVLTNATTEAKRMRSQSASIEANVSEAFDAIVCTPSANKDSLVCF